MFYLLDRIHFRTLIIFAILLLATLSAFLFLSYRDIQLTHKINLESVNKQIEKKQYLSEMYRAARNRSILLIKMYREKDALELDELNQEFSSEAGKFVGARLKLFSYGLDQNEKDILEEQKDASIRHTVIVNKVAELFLNGNYTEGETILFDQAIPAQNHTLDKLDEIIKYYDQDSKNRAVSLEERKNLIDSRFKAFTLLLLLGGGAFIVLLFIYITRKEKNDLTSKLAQQKNVADKLSYQASHDALTNLINRREFESRLKQLLERAIDNEHHAVLYLDLDQFKVINDTCGHHAGDELLKQLPEIIRENLRSSDLLARLGGDEFAIILMNCEMNKVKEICAAIIKSVIDFQFVWDDKTFKVGVSIGVVEIDDSSVDLYDTLRFADSACYAAKDAGRNQFKVHTYNDKDLKIRTDEMDWLAIINTALEQNLFVLYAQIIVPTDSDSELKPHYELLLRMNLNGEIIPPGAFLPSAERYHQMIDVDRYVISNAVSLMKKNLPFLESIDHVSINLSALSLENEDFLTFLLDEIGHAGFPDKICLEVTETAIINKLSNVKKAIKELREIGVRFSLDDFGSGQSSYAYLKNLDVDFLKIDGYFVKDILTDSVDLAMVNSMRDIGAAMNKKTIAEFVENEEILAMLKIIGIDYAQGFGIGMPLPFSDILKIDEINRNVMFGR